MEVWGFMEMIHSRSYTYIIKNVYSDPSEVFDKIVTDNRILERAASVTQSYDDFIGAAHHYDNTNDLKSDEVEEEKSDLNNLLNELEQAEEGECESCAV